jgi:hypothetical protein
MRATNLYLTLVLPLSLLWACGSSSGGDINDGTGQSTGGSVGTAGSGLALGGDALGSGGDAGITLGGSFASAGSNSATSGSASGGVAATGVTACSNGKDDDGDGLIDGFDPECTGARDDDEGTYATGIPGDNRDPKWQDCFFDGNSGAGDDNCRYATGCLTGELEPDDKNCTLTDACIEFCAPLTPNGCDCFGCCTVQTKDGETVDIQTSASCSLDKVDDTEACPRCEKSDACGNTCGRCELCPGKTIADLPDDCATGSGGAGSGGSSSTGGSSTGGSNTGGTGGGPAYTCDGGDQVCGPDLSACPSGQYCSFGCCLLQPPK